MVRGYWLLGVPVLGDQSFIRHTMLAAFPVLSLSKHLSKYLQEGSQLMPLLLGGAASTQRQLHWTPSLLSLG